MDRKVIIIFFLVILLHILIGVMFLSPNKEIDISEFKHKYDSINKIVMQNNLTVKVNADLRDSVKKIVNKLQDEISRLQKNVSSRQNVFLEDKENYRNKLRLMSDTQISKEINQAYTDAYPAPLFDSISEEIIVGKAPVIHLLEESKRAQYLALENTDLLKVDTLRTRQLMNVQYQITKYQSDSIVLNNTLLVQNQVISTQNSEMQLVNKKYKKELRKQKIQKVTATIVAVLATIAAIVF